ncbi:MAG: hypothetical protein HYY44_07390 [Deltaproteobacteria bacterium]|nr:hypothetical protein [Deltaproteobacteria bacterium]
MAFPASTQERLPGGKSLKTVKILSYLPINAPALIYAGRPLKGTVLTFVEIYGFGAMTAPMITWCAGSDKENCDLALALLVTGTVLWLPSWIYSLVKAPQYVDEYNRRIQERQISLRPWFRLENDKFLTTSAGLAFRF